MSTTRSRTTNMCGSGAIFCIPQDQGSAPTAAIRFVTQVNASVCELLRYYGTQRTSRLPQSASVTFINMEVLSRAVVHDWKRSAEHGGLSLAVWFLSTLERQARVLVPLMFMAHEPQMPSRHDRRNDSVLSSSSLILNNTSSIMGPHWFVSICGSCGGPGSEIWREVGTGEVQEGTHKAHTCAE